MGSKKTTQVGEKILQAVIAKGGNKSHFDRVLTEENLAMRIAELLIIQQDQNIAVSQNIFFTSLSDDQAIQILIPIIGEEEARKMVKNWRHFATDFFSYAGPIAWLVKAGYTLKQHASKLGPCYKNLEYLQTWNFNDDPTSDSLVFWVPRTVPDSTRKTADEQLKHLEKLRKKYDLPIDHLADFGSVALNSGLILSHFNQTKERVPLDRLWIRSSTRNPDGARLDLGGFGERGLDGSCYWDGDRVDFLGCFALGVVKLAA